jgi:hypothetical protein
VYAQVSLLLALGLLLLAHIRLMLVVDELDDGGPGVAVVDVVPEARGVDDGELDLELLLLELGLDDLDLGELVELLDMASAVVLCGRQLGGEEGVDERRFAQSRLAWASSAPIHCHCFEERTNDHDCEVCAAFGDNLVFLKNHERQLNRYAAART